MDTTSIEQGTKLIYGPTIPFKSPKDTVMVKLFHLVSDLVIRQELVINPPDLLRMGDDGEWKYSGSFGAHLFPPGRFGILAYQQGTAAQKGRLGEIPIACIGNLDALGLAKCYNIIKGLSNLYRGKTFDNGSLDIILVLGGKIKTTPRS